MKNRTTEELLNTRTDWNNDEMTMYYAFVGITACYSFDFRKEIKHISIRFQEGELKELENLKELMPENIGLYKNDQLVYLIALLEASDGTTRSEIIPLPRVDLTDYLTRKQHSCAIFNEYYLKGLCPVMEEIGYCEFFSPKALGFDKFEYYEFYDEGFELLWDVGDYKDHEKIYIVSTEGEKYFAPRNLPVYSVDEYNNELLKLGRLERIITKELPEEINKISQNDHEKFFLHSKELSSQSGVLGLMKFISDRKLRYEVHRLLRDFKPEDFESKLVFSTILERKVIIIPKDIYEILGVNKFIITEKVLRNLERKSLDNSGLVGIFRSNENVLETINPA